ncbi:ABC transporter permease [Chelativorans sp. Marseille-P2723]|uniref:ABC transporter permease n=1 Tax=Chelativorans sp. Marseille-P2723 TaxID=2709133 RepID=UPI00156FBF51|nr:ABC transporter permease [Chelativorans sp. Marseille-P2723]
MIVLDKDAAVSHLQRRPRVSLERGAIILVTALWVLGALMPILALFVISVLRAKGLSFDFSLTLQAYRDVLVDFRLEIILRTLRVVAVVTLIEFLLGYPFAIWLAKGIRSGLAKSIILVLLVVPFFLSPAARTIVWRSILGNDGLINNLLLSVGLVDTPVSWLLFSEFAVHLGLIGPYFPSMVWPIFISVSLIDDELIKASRDLGATGLQTLWYVVTPLAVPGIVAGFLFTAIPMLGDNVASTLLGGGRVALIAESFDDLIRAMNFTGAAALGAILVVAVIATALIIRWVLVHLDRNNGHRLKVMSS